MTATRWAMTATKNDGDKICNHDNDGHNNDGHKKITETTVWPSLYRLVWRIREKIIRTLLCCSVLCIELYTVISTHI